MLKQLTQKVPEKDKVSAPVPRARFKRAQPNLKVPGSRLAKQLKGEAKLESPATENIPVSTAATPEEVKDKSQENVENQTENSQTNKQINQNRSDQTNKSEYVENQKENTVNIAENRTSKSENETNKGLNRENEVTSTGNEESKTIKNANIPKNSFQNETSAKKKLKFLENETKNSKSHVNNNVSVAVSETITENIIPSSIQTKRIIHNKETNKISENSDTCNDNTTLKHLNLCASKKSKTAQHDNSDLKGKESYNTVNVETADRDNESTLFISTDSLQKEKAYTSSDIQKSLDLTQPTQIQRSRFKKAQPNLKFLGNRFPKPQPILPVPQKEPEIVISLPEPIAADKQSAGVLNAELSVSQTVPCVSSAPKNDFPYLTSLLKSPKKRIEHKEIANKRKRYAKGESPPERSKMTMMDLIYWNPSGSPMKSSSKNQKVADIVPSSPGFSPENDESSKAEPEIEPDSANMPGPRLAIGENGEIIIDEESLIIRRTAPDIDPSTTNAVFEDNNTTYSSFRKQIVKKGWTNKETAKFYKALSVVGTDFSLMENLLPNRSRRELKLKFKREEKQNTQLIDKVLYEPQKFDVSIFEEDNELEELIEECSKKTTRKRKSKKIAQDDENKAPEEEPSIQNVSNVCKKRGRKKHVTISTANEDHSAQDPNNDGEDQDLRVNRQNTLMEGSVEVDGSQASENGSITPRRKRKRKSVLIETSEEEDYEECNVLYGEDNGVKEASDKTSVDVTPNKHHSRISNRHNKILHVENTVPTELQYSKSNFKVTEQLNNPKIYERSPKASHFLNNLTSPIISTITESDDTTAQDVQIEVLVEEDSNNFDSTGEISNSPEISSTEFQNIIRNHSTPRNNQQTHKSPYRNSSQIAQVKNGKQNACSTVHLIDDLQRLFNFTNVSGFEDISQNYVSEDSVSYVCEDDLTHSVIRDEFNGATNSAFKSPTDETLAFTHVASVQDVVTSEECDDPSIALSVRKRNPKKCIASKEPPTRRRRSACAPKLKPCLKSNVKRNSPNLSLAARCANFTPAAEFPNYCEKNLEFTPSRGPTYNRRKIESSSQGTPNLIMSSLETPMFTPERSNLSTTLNGSLNSTFTIPLTPSPCGSRDPSTNEAPGSVMFFAQSPNENNVLHVFMYKNGLSAHPDSNPAFSISDTKVMKPNTTQQTNLLNNSQLCK